MAHKITVGSGLETFEIEFVDRGVTAEIAFNPSDPDLPKRLYEAQNIIDEKTKIVKQYEVDENGVPNIEGAVDYLNEANQIVYDAVDYAFGNKISDVLFQHCSPYAIVNGEYFIWTFFNAMAPVLEDIINKSQKKANENMNKYLSKYMKKR